MVSLLTNLFPLKFDLQVANELFNCNWSYLTKLWMWNLPLQCGKCKCLKYSKLLANFIQCDSKLNGFC